MKDRGGLVIALAIAAVVLTAVLLYPSFRGEEPAEVTEAGTSEQPEQAPVVSEAAPAREEAGTQQTTARTAAAAPTIPTPAADVNADPTKITFKANPKGRLVTDENARLNLEKLLALYSPAERQQKLDELSATLPPAAARDLNDMMERYINFDAAQKQTFPPGQEVASSEEILNMIDGMHNLRVQYFGADAAEGFFGKDERMQRELHQLIANEKDDSMTMEEKAERAQAIWASQMPETAAEIATGRKRTDR